MTESSPPNFLQDHPQTPPCHLHFPLSQPLAGVRTPHHLVLESLEVLHCPLFPLLLLCNSLPLSFLPGLLLCFPLCLLSHVLSLM